MTTTKIIGGWVHNLSFRESQNLRFFLLFMKIINLLF